MPSNSPRRPRIRRSCAAAIGVAFGALLLAACQPPAPIEPGNPGASDVTLNVRSDQAVHAISPLIYGVNGTDQAATTHQSLSRMGGNRWTAYNWESNASNAGSDYCFQNDNFLSTSATPGSAVNTQLGQAEASHTAAIVTVPIVSYVAGDEAGGSGPPACGGDVRKSTNYLTTRMKSNQAVEPGTLTTTPNTTDANVYENQFVYLLKQTHPNANVLFSLDNEPDLWASTHAEVQSSPVTYADLANRDVTFARAIKDVWPTAPVLGPVSYGWNGFTSLQNAPDAASHGDFLNWWLDQMHAADTAGNRRLVDYMDLHWYPEAQGGGVRITNTDANSAATVAARVQAPRSLWDSTYTEDSWITRDAGSGPIRLIGRMKDKIAAHYPGTMLAMTEWNYGGGSSTAGGANVSEAVASADALGVFGSQGMDLASYWQLAPHEEYTFAAFKAFRNFDSNGAGFGDTAEFASSSDTATATVYASHDAANPSRVVIVAINKSTAAKTAAVRVADPTAFGHAKVYQITSAAPQVVAGADLTTSATNAYRYTMPPMSVSVIVPF